MGSKGRAEKWAAIQVESENRPSHPKQQARQHNMKTIAAHLILLLGVASGLRADDDGYSILWKLEGYKRGYWMAEAAYFVDQEELPDTPDGNREREDSREDFKTKATKLFNGALDLAESNPSSREGFAALEWILTQYDSYDMPVGSTALRLVAEQYAEDPRIGTLMANLSYYPPRESSASRQPAMDLIKLVAETNPERTARGQALLGLASLLRKEFEEAEFRQNPDLSRVRSEAQAAYEMVLEDYGDCRYLRTCGIRAPRKTLGEEARIALFDLNHLSEGQVAPEIEGEDLDGVKFKLSDYRGKVVLLVFWASWCGPCIRDIPHEKELVKRFNDRPFVLIGVNGDRVKARAAETVETHGIPWRSFSDEGQASGTPISVAWNVGGWPTIYVLDHEGVIRHRYLRGDELDEPVEALVSVAEASQPDSE